MKALILDSGVLINLSLSGMLDVLTKFKKVSSTKFLITEAVKYETVDRPIGVPRFELGALIIKKLIEDKTIEMPTDLGIDKNELESLTANLLDKANHSFESNKKPLQIVSKGEISCLALSKILTEKNIENVIAIDERTTRLLSEKPENLENTLSSRLHTRVTLKRENLEEFTKFRFIRTAELLYAAFKKNLFDIKDPKTLEAVIYAAKYHGTAISWEEIEELKKL